MSEPKAKRDRGVWASTPNAYRGTPGRSFNLDVELSSILDELKESGVRLSELAREALWRHPKVKAKRAERLQRKGSSTP